MNGNTLLMLLVVAAALGALLLFSSPSSAPAAATTGTVQGTASTAPQAAAIVSVPWAEAGEDQIVGEREAVHLKGSGGDSSGAAVAYRWSSDSNFGFFSDPTRPDATYTAPSACDCCQAVTLTLTVTSRSGATANDSMVVRVRDPLACRSGCASSCPTSVVAPVCPVAVRSTCPQPDVPCAGPCVMEAPAEPACTQVPVPCRCGEGCAAVWDSAWPQGHVPLAAADRPTPQIVRQFASHVVEGSATLLRAVVRNPSCSSVCFTWSASQGWFEGADTLEPIYHAPLTNLTRGERVTITFTIHDESGQPSYDQIRLYVDNVPTS